MNWWYRWRRRDTLEAQLDAELRDHFERLVTDYRHEGLDHAEAIRRARLDFGGLDQVKEMCRDARGTRWLQDGVADVQYGWRSLRRTPTFTAVAVTALALGVAAAMTVFNIVEALLLRPLPVPHANDLVTIVRWQAGNSSDHFSYPQIRLLSERTDLFAALAAVGSDTVNVGAPDALEPTAAAWVNGDFFETLGLTPFAGRLLTAVDDEPGAAPAAVITHSYWMRRFGGDTSVIGMPLLIEGVRVPIVGVTPRGFTGVTVGEQADITLAIRARPQLQPENDGFLSADARWLRVLGRPARGVVPEQLQVALDTAWPAILEATLPRGINQEARARTLTMTVTVHAAAQGTSRMRMRYRPALTMATALVLLVLVIACVNVANLLLARAASRCREIALRLAIGAGRGRIVRQLLTESAVLAALGTTIGVALGATGSRGLVALIAGSASGVDSSAVWLDVAPNWRMAAAAVLVMAVVTFLFGLVPAWRASGMEPHPRSASDGRVAVSHGRLAASLIVAQVALSLALVVGAGLFARTLQNLRALDRGFRTEDVLLASFDPSRTLLAPADLREFNRAVLTTVERLPAVRAVTLAAVTPLQGGGMSRPLLVNRISTGDEDVYYNVIGPRYFEIMQTPLLTGRDVVAADDANSPGVTVVNEAFVRRYFGATSALGQRVSFSQDDTEMQIVGVVKDAVYETLRAAPPPTIYLPYLQQRGRPMTLVVDAPIGAAAAAAAIRAEVQPRVPTQPLRVRTLRDQVESSLVRERLLALLAGTVAALALTLAAVGLYGLVSYSVSTRTREIGVRLALGATHLRIESSVLQSVLRLVALGIAVGLPVTWGLSRFTAGVTFGVSTTDPITTAGAMTTLTIVGLLAALGPARRAARVDPALSLRSE